MSLSTLPTRIYDYFYDWYRSVVCKTLKCGPLPGHVAFIMDGNRRYAKKNHEQTIFGHQMGERRLQDTLKWCLELGIKEVSVFAFSIENFKRSSDEVEPLMKIAEAKFKEILNNEDFRRQNRIRVFGDLHLLPPELSKLAAEAQYVSRNNSGSVLNICLAYTSTHEIAESIRTVVGAVSTSELSLEDITPGLVEQCLYTRESLPIDIIVRTSGEIRLSDFMLWQSTTAQLAFLQVLWPEFAPSHLYETVLKYQLHYNELTQAKQGGGAKQSPALTPNGSAFVQSQIRRHYDTLKTVTEAPTTQELVT